MQILRQSHKQIITHAHTKGQRWIKLELFFGRNHVHFRRVQLTSRGKLLSKIQLVVLSYIFTYAYVNCGDIPLYINLVDI